MKQPPRESRAKHDEAAADPSGAAPDRWRWWSPLSSPPPLHQSFTFTSSTLSRLFIISLFSLALLLQLVSDVSARRSVVPAPNFSLSPPKANRARIQYKTTYACEHRELHLSCEPNEAIHLVRANYGRFSLSICNEGGRADLSVNCMSYRSFLIMTDRCMNKSSCSVVVSSQLFGDPCPGTAKYLEVQYHCVKGGASQSTKRPPEQSVDAIDEQQQQQQNISSNVNYPIQLPPLPSVPTTTYAPIAGEKDDESTASVVIANSARQSNSSDTAAAAAASDHPVEMSSSPSSTAIYPVPFNQPSISTPAAPAPSTPSPLPLEPYDPSGQNTAFISVEDYCPSVFMRSLFWNWTQKGQVSTQKCPGGASGYVKWQCNFNPDLGLAEWFPMRPDFSECRSVWLDSLEERLNKDDESVIRISHELALMTLTKALYSDDLQRISHLIKLSLDRAAGNVLHWHTIEVWHKHQMLKELLIYIVETISNLLGNAQDDAWLDLNIANRKDVASALIKSLESSALLLAENTNHDGSSAIAKANVLVSVHVLDTRMPISLQFPTNEDTSGTNEWIRMEDSIFLPAQSLVDHSQNGLAKVAFFAYYRIEDLLKPSQHTDMERFSSLLSTRLHNFSQSSQLSINSRVIGAAISHNGQIQHLPLSQPVTVVLRHIQDENIASPRCVYWNVDRQNWFTDGCWVEATNSTHTVCMCNHLTHFALLNEVKAASSEAVVDGERMERNVALVGCLLSLAILALVSVLIFLTPTGSTVSSSIHRNLCLTLFVSESIYLIALFGADIPHVFFFCLAFLHYFLMCSFFWTFFESFDIYMNVNSIYEHFKSSKRLYWYYIIAYLSPAFICLTCFIIDANCYRNFANIWLRADNYLYLTLVGPAIGLALASLVFILFAFILTRNHVITTTTIKCFEDIRVGGSKSLIRWILLLLLFQALNWSTALVYLSKQDSTLLAVLFALSNVATALFLAVFCVLKIENVQHSRLFRHLPFTLCQDESQLSSAKNSTTSSDVYSTRPVVTQVTSTQVNGMNHGLHGTPPLGHSPSTPTATSPVSMSPCLPQSHPLPISQSTHWNCQQDSPKKSTALDHQSILAQQDPSCLLYSLNQMKTLPREFNPSFCGGQEAASMRNIEGMLSNKKRAKAAQANFEFASLHRPGNLGNRKQFGGHENKYSVQSQGVHTASQFAPNLDHIYESIDSDQALYEYQRRLNMQNFYGGANNYRSKSTVNDDDLSSSSIYEDKPLLLANHNSTLSYDNHKSKRIFVPQHYHSNASIYDNKSGPYRETRISPQMAQDGLQQQQQQQQPGTTAGVALHGQPGALWHFGKEPYELPDLLQKSGNASNLLVSYSGENRFLNQVVVNSGKSTHAK